MNSINEIFQCRPTFHNLVSSELQSETMDDSDNESKGNDEILHQISLKRKESEKAQATRLQSYSYIHAQEEAEDWKKIEIHHINSAEVSSIINDPDVLYNV